MLEFLSSTKFGLIGGSISVILLIWLQPLIRKFWLKLNSLKRENYNRSLSDADITWLNQSSFRLSKEKSQRDYPRWIFLLSQGFVPVLIGMGLLFGIIHLALKFSTPDIDTSALSWSRMNIGISSVLAIFLGIFSASMVMIILSRKSSTVRDYLTYKYGWGYASPRPRGELEIKQELEHQLRLENISPKTEFNSEELSDLIFHRTTPAWKTWTIILSLATLFFFILDSRSYYTVYPDRIESSSYFSLKKNNYSMENTSKVRRRCILAIKKKNPYSRFEFILEMEDGAKIDLLSEHGPDEAQQFAAIEAILPFIPKSSFNTTQVKSAPILKLSPTLENCSLLLNRNKSSKDAARLSKLFDLNSN